VLLTRPPLELKTLVRLACVKHTASVHPEPGSNSLQISINFLELLCKSISIMLNYRLLIKPDKK
jgi:hypothetical protein